MKVLQVNVVYKEGSTGKIVYDIHRELLERQIESIVCYGRGERIVEHNVHKTCFELASYFNNIASRVSGVRYGGHLIATTALIRRIQTEKPDVVHLHCLNGDFVNIYRLIRFLKKHQIKTVLSLHAEFMHTANCGHALDCEKWKTGCGNCPRLKQETRSVLLDRTHESFRRMQNVFEGFDDHLIVTAVSPWLMNRAKQSLILADKQHQVVLNGLESSVFRVYNTATLKKEHGFTDEKIIFHATPNFDLDPTHIKGACHVIEVAKKLQEMRIKIIVAGRYDQTKTYPENIIFLGNVSDQQKLAQYYSMADLTLLTSQKETFSMICAESLSCGTPIVGFQAGAPEQISLPNYSEFLPYADCDLLVTTMQTWLSRTFDAQTIEKQAHQRYAKEKMTAGYLAIYNKLMEEQS